MGIFKVTCTNTSCNNIISVDSGTWDVTKEFISVNCPVCGKLVKRYINSRYDPKATENPSPAPAAANNAATEKKGGTEVIIGHEHPHHEESVLTGNIGWLIDRSSLKHYGLKLAKQTVGRSTSSKKSDVPIETEDLYMGGAHCIIDAKIGKSGLIEFELADNDSVNKVLLNQRELRKGEILYIRDKDVIKLGESEFIFVSIYDAKGDSEIKSWIIDNIKIIR